MKVGGVRALLAAAQEGGVPLVIPPIVVTQIVRGGARDAEANHLFHLFHSAYIPFVGERLTRVAGQLLAVGGLSDAADAQVVAEARRLSPATVLTSDPGDIGRLASGLAGVRVIAV